MWVMWVYIMLVKTWYSKYAKIAKQNVSRVFRGKAFPVKYSQKLAVMTLRILVMCSTRGSLCGKASREIHFVFNWRLSLRTLSHTQPIQ